MGLFGKKAEYVAAPYVPAPPRQAPGPSMDQSIHNAEMRTGNLDSRLASLETEIATLKREMQRHRPGSSSHNMYKRRALQAMRQRKSLEQRCSMSANAAFNLEQVRDARHMQSDNVAMVQGLRTANQELNGVAQDVNLDEVEDLRDDLADAMADVNEVGEVLGRSYDVDNVDQGELEAELDELEAESFANPSAELSTPSYLRPSALESPGAPQASQVHPNYAPPNAQMQGMPAPRY